MPVSRFGAAGVPELSQPSRVAARPPKRDWSSTDLTQMGVAHSVAVVASYSVTTRYLSDPRAARL